MVPFGHLQGSIWDLLFRGEVPRGKFGYHLHKLAIPNLQSLVTPFSMGLTTKLTKSNLGVVFQSSKPEVMLFGLYLDNC